MLIREIMSKEPVMVDKDATIIDAVKQMKNEGCGLIPIGDVNHVMGVITDRDIITRAVAEEMDLATTPVTTIMTVNLISCDENSPLHEVVYKMNKYSVRRLLVLNKKGTLTGVVSLGDVIRRVEDKALLAELFSETVIA